MPINGMTFGVQALSSSLLDADPLLSSCIGSRSEAYELLDRSIRITKLIIPAMTGRNYLLNPSHHAVRLGDTGTLSCRSSSVSDAS